MDRTPLLDVLSQKVIAEVDGAAVRVNAALHEYPLSIGGRVGLGIQIILPALHDLSAEARAETVGMILGVLMEAVSPNLSSNQRRHVANSCPHKRRRRAA